ncbi:MAG TPA: endolytic transglycosylase MltG [Spirochaetota bacterium]|nr:endolytic transglycosylase MltG [Spirochaetota bacterium]
MKRILIVIIAALLLVSAAVLILDSAPSGMAESVFVINEGQALRRVAAELYKAGLITSPRFFVLLCSARPGFTYKSGKYKIYSGMKTHEVISMFGSGSQITSRVTIPEGYNIYEIAEKLEDAGITSASEFIEFCQNRQFLESTGIHSVSAEGYLFPDTYVFAEDMDARNVIALMHGRFRDVIKSIGYDRIKNSGMKLDDLVRLASLIEEEAAVPSERKYVSSVFHNRIRKGMRFDCDPTVRYALRKFRGRLYFDDLKIDSPYNTYMYKGFPPTAISCPGRDSIMAALQPAATAYLYFVARNDRSHYFSATLREHNRAVEKYIKRINNGFIDNQRLN